MVPVTTTTAPTNHRLKVGSLLFTLLYCNTLWWHFCQCLTFHHQQCKPTTTTTKLGFWFGRSSTVSESKYKCRSLPSPFLFISFYSLLFNYQKLEKNIVGRDLAVCHFILTMQTGANKQAKLSKLTHLMDEIKLGKVSALYFTNAALAVAEVQTDWK